MDQVEPAEAAAALQVWPLGVRSLCPQTCTGSVLDRTHAKAGWKVLLIYKSISKSYELWFLEISGSKFWYIGSVLVNFAKTEQKVGLTWH